MRPGDQRHSDVINNILRGDIVSDDDLRGIPAPLRTYSFKLHFGTILATDQTSWEHLFSEHTPVEVHERTQCTDILHAAIRASQQEW